MWSLSLSYIYTYMYYVFSFLVISFSFFSKNPAPHRILILSKRYDVGDEEKGKGERNTRERKMNPRRCRGCRLPPRISWLAFFSFASYIYTISTRFRCLLLGRLLFFLSYSTPSLLLFVLQGDFSLSLSNIPWL